MSLSDNLDKADSVQSELLTLAEDLAAELRILPTQRDGAKIRALWKQINAIRPRLSSLHRKLRKQRTSLPTTASRAAKAVHRDQMREIKAIGARLTHWQNMARLVEAHIGPPQHPINLHRDPYPTDGALLHLHRALHRMANRKEQKKDAADHKCFADIAFPIVAFEELVRAAYRLLLIMGRAQSARFLDVGCGGGVKLVTASHYFVQCDGLEYDAGYVKAARKMLKITGDSDACTVFRGDALTFDDYGDYDVIYYYRPITDADLLAQMEARIFSTARPGTIILAPYHTDLTTRPDTPYVPVTDCVFITGMDEPEAKTLLAEAAYTSRFPLTPSPFPPGFWTPILRAASVGL